MADTSNLVFRLLRRVKNSIAFYPALIAAFYISLAAAVTAFEQTKLASELDYNLPQGLTQVDNVRAILGTLTTSVISLAVFSFSMVMIVLNSAAARLTPRVLPGLISETRNRAILGVYLGSILYYLIQLGLLNESQPHDTPSLGILLALLTGMLCMVLFVVFIHSVSQSIQVEWVINGLYESACKELTARKARLAKAPPEPDDSEWCCLNMQRSGYLREVNEDRLLELLSRRDLVARLQVEPGFFLIEGHPLIKFSGRLSKKEAAEALDCFHFHSEEFPTEHATYGMRQMSEIAVKAVSPAVNDPGTAVRAINLLSVLLSRHMGMPEFNVGCFDCDTPRLYYRELPMDQLLYTVLGPIRYYGGHDPQVLIALIQCIKNTLHCEPTREQLRAVYIELRALCEEADDKLTNQRDRRVVNELLQRLNRVETGMPDMTLATAPNGDDKPAD